MVKGAVYALLDVASGMIWTERSEQAARQLATDKRLTVIDEQAISHEELLRLIGHEPAPKAPQPASNANVATESVEPIKDVEPGVTSPFTAEADSPVMTFPVRYHLEDEPDFTINDADVIAQPTSQPVSGIFCSEGEIAPKVPSAPIEHHGTE
jgi:hypothetical protein